MQEGFTQAQPPTDTAQIEPHNAQIRKARQDADANNFSTATTPKRSTGEAASQPPHTPISDIRAALNQAYGSLLDDLQACGWSR